MIRPKISYCQFQYLRTACLFLLFAYVCALSAQTSVATRPGNLRGLRANIPASCAEGSFYFAIDAPAGHNVYACRNRAWSLAPLATESGYGANSSLRNYKAKEAALLAGGSTPIHIALIGDSWISNGFIQNPLGRELLATYSGTSVSSAGSGFIPANSNDQVPDPSLPRTYSWTRSGVWTDCGTAVVGTSSTCVGANNSDAKSMDASTPGRYGITDTMTDFSILWYRTAGGGASTIRLMAPRWAVSARMERPVSAQR